MAYFQECVYNTASHKYKFPGALRAKKKKKENIEREEGKKDYKPQGVTTHKYGRGFDKAKSMRFTSRFQELQIHT